MIDVGPPPLIFPKPGIIRAVTPDLIRPESPQLANIFPQWFPGAALLTRRVATLTYITSATSTLGTITIPATAQAGDLALYTDICFPSPVEVVPTGFTKWAGGLLNTVRMVSAYKILVSGDPGASITGMNDDNDNKAMIIVRGNIPITSVAYGGATAGTPAQEYTGSNPASQSINAGTLAGAPSVICSTAYGSNGTTTGQVVWSPNEDAIIAAGGGTLGSLYYLVQNTPANVTIDMPDQGTTNMIASAYFACF